MAGLSASAFFRGRRRSRVRDSLGVLGALASLVALIVAIPLLVLVAKVFAPDTQGVWAHLAETVLQDYVLNSLVLAAGSGVGAAILGTGTAWLLSMHRFPGSRQLEWMLLLPLAMPTYVIAYVYTDVLQYAGPLQTALREHFSWERDDYWFPEVRSLGGAIVIFSLVFYPYVYLLARSAFAERAAGMVEAARSLGMGPWSAFRRVALPLARPAIVGGAALVVMESLAEFGAVAYFGVPTFTTGIYRAWYSFGDPVAAAQLASALLGFVLIALSLERLSRGRARFHDVGTRRSAPSALRGPRALGAIAVCVLPLAGGFLIPAGLLLQLAVDAGDVQFGAKYLRLAANSLILAILASVLAVVLAVLLAYAARLRPNGWMRAITRVASLGYATPGTVIAVGILIPLTALDHFLDAVLRSQFGISSGLLLTGGIAALLYAYVVRFLSVAFNSVEASLLRIRPSMDEAARSLGYGRAAVLWRVHLPLLRGGLAAAVLLVFVDVMKELPATIVMRPFDFDTLATQVFILAADERLAEAATPSLAIVAVGLIPVVLLSRAIRRPHD